MAQLLSPPQGSERISQILPTVKCSSCNSPVPISQLENHTCLKPPPVPAVKPPITVAPRAPNTFLPQKYQNLVSPRSQTPQTRPPHHHPPPPATIPPSRATTPLGPQRQKSPAPTTATTQPLRRRATSSSSTSSKTTRYSERSDGSSYSTGTVKPDNDKVAFPSRAETVVSPVRQGSSTRSPEPNGERALSLGRAVSVASSTSSSSGRRSILQGGTPPPGALALRSRTPSNAGMRPVPPNAFRQPAQSSPTPYVPLPQGPASPPGALATSPRPRAITNAGGPPDFQTGPDVIYSTSNRAPMAQYDPRLRAPSNASAHSYMQPPRPPVPVMPSVMYPPPDVEIDTKSGGEAGMAGVGRRGFAAAARAAMFAQTMAPSTHTHVDQRIALHLDTVQGMDGRRANAPKFLDIASARNYGANTPPLSPNSGSSLSPHSPLSATLPSPSKDDRAATPKPSAITPRTPSPTGSFLQNGAVVPPIIEPPTSSLSITPTMPFFEKFKNKHVEADTTVQPPLNEDQATPLSPKSESSYGGLAYADSTDDEDDSKAQSQPPAMAPTTTHEAPKSNTNHVHFPPMTPKRNSVAKSESNYSATSPTPSPRLPMRSLSDGSSVARRSGGVLDRSMEILLEEEPASPTATSNSSPAGFPVGDSHRDSKPPKLPTRSHTNPAASSGRQDSHHGSVSGRKRSKKTCLKCDRAIEDGRWIQMDGGSVLCDRCWKNMYLPKCRRCNLPIEKHAISSSDGQLKGKYHKECFTCFTCHKPFPDKSFYVFDGKPFCGYHYHEANDSLCAAAKCGQPIEGPCAVSHNGDKYHPEHLLCEHSRCTERLEDYWEIDGWMLCEQHAMAKGRSNDEDEGRATRRKTRFIDLASLGSPKLGPGPGAEEDGIR